MGVQLTKAGDKLICLIYKEYLSRRKDGEDKRKTKDFANPFAWPDSMLQNFPRDDISDTLPELKHAGLIDLYAHDGFQLKDEAIVYMEQRFPEGVASVLDWLAKIKDAIPFA